jgi:hypothetical protein
MSFSRTSEGTRVAQQEIMPPASTRPETRPTLPAAIAPKAPTRVRTPRRRTVTVWIGDTPFQALVV